MRTLFAALVLTPAVCFAAPTTSIHLEFNGSDGFSVDSYSVPDRTVDAQVNLTRLSSGSLEYLCYEGKAQNVVKMLDRLIKKAGLIVSNYDRSIRNDKIFAKLSVTNFNDKIQTADLTIETCN